MREKAWVPGFESEITLLWVETQHVASLRRPLVQAVSSTLCLLIYRTSLSAPSPFGEGEQNGVLTPLSKWLCITHI